MGLPKTICTSGRPGTGTDAVDGIAAYAPTSAIGSTCTSWLIDSPATPAVNRAIAPVRLRVPSGKISSGTPSSSSRPDMPRCARARMPPRSIG